jgi:type IV secretory pathway VirJ component
MRISLLLACFFFAATATSAGAESLSHGRFRDVQIYRPAGNVKQVALFLSGEEGWDRGMAGMASRLAADGSLVAGIDVRSFIASLEEDDADCVFPDGDLENLSHFIQAYYKLPTYFTPVLVGYSEGASLANATLAQAPRGVFAGALAISFRSELEMRKALCKADPRRHSTLNVHHIEGPRVRHDYSRAPEWMSQFSSAYATLIANAPSQLPAPPADLADLPLIEVPATGTGDLFAILLSGDGGWAGLDKEVAAALSERGVPVVGVDSLRRLTRRE